MLTARESEMGSEVWLPSVALRLVLFKLSWLRIRSKSAELELVAVLLLLVWTLD
jgi:hypothetical protein